MGSHHAQGSLYSSSWHFFVVVFDILFSSHRSLESFLQPRQPFHCCCVCPSLLSSKLLGDDFPDGHPRKISACWGHDQLQASGLQRCLPYLPSSSTCPFWVLAKLVLTAGSLYCVRIVEWMRKRDLPVPSQPSCFVLPITTSSKQSVSLP